MARQQINKFAFYRYRYHVAYTVFAIALAALLTLAGLYLPGGITQSEVNSMLISDGVTLSQIFSMPPDKLIYLPYRLLQSASLDLFGVSVISIKLPSIILGFISAIGLLYLLNIWYKKSVAIIVAIIAVTTSQFLLASQAGQAGITYIFFTVMILISASMISRQNAYARAWALLGFILAALSLYMPLNVYMLLALLLTAVIHPHARYVVFQKSSKVIIGIGLLLSTAIASPLIAGIFREPSILKNLFGIPNNLSNIADNATELLNSYTNFLAPSAGSTITPIYGLGLVILIFVGAYRLVTTKHTARSYLIGFWLLGLVPLIFLNHEFISITFVPVILLVALGVDYIILSWYKLFPKNPYARVFGLAPLGILMIGLILSSIDQYAYGLHYDKAVYSAYKYDLPLLQNKLKTFDKDTSVTLLTSKQRSPFYSSFARHQDYVKSLTVLSDTAKLPDDELVIAERDFASTINKIPSEILVTRSSSEANRFYLYKNN